MRKVNKHEIDHRTMKLIVGVIALALANLTNYFSEAQLTSISEAYHKPGWPQAFFIGFLFAIASFLLAFNGRSIPEMVASKFAALAALGVALFPCKCKIYPEIIPQVHFAAAAVMFLILTYFCWLYFWRALRKPYRRAKARAAIYALCGVAMAASIAVLAFDNFTGERLSAKYPSLEFYGEAIGLWAFGISWLTASKAIPVLTNSREWFIPLVKVPAEEEDAPAVPRDAAGFAVTRSDAIRKTG